MNEKWKGIMQAASVLLLLAVCIPTGGSQSPFRFAYYLLIILLSLRVGFTLLLQAGFSFSILFVLLVALDHPPNRHLADLMAEALSFFLVTITAAVVSRNLATERERAENATATFHSMNEDLKHRTMNLQMTLEALSEAHKRLQESDREKTSFLANVSHELRTPLSSIRSYSEILLTYDDIDNETRRDFIRTINSESERMTTLVNDNLDLIRLDTGKIELNISQINPAELISESIKVVAPLALNKHLALELDIASAPPIRGDRQQLSQVLINLLNNAIKFTAEGKIIAGVTRRGDSAEFFVEDTGEGIFPEEQDVIFTEFFRIAGSLPDRPPGSGLGLSIAKKIVEYHGGRIWVDSTPGKGSTFYFAVPVAAAEERTALDARSQEMGMPPDGYGPILVLYENAAIRQSLRKRLEKVGYQTLGADTPARGLAIAGAVKPGLIIVDFTARSSEFLELEHWAKGNGIEVLLAALCLSPASGELALAAHGYLEKPLDKYQLTSLLEQVQKVRGRCFVISPEQEEARHLQVLLGAEGYSSALYLDEMEAARASGASFPHAVIIGSFPVGRRQEIAAFLKGVPQFGGVPFFLIQGGSWGSYITVVSSMASGHTSGGEGLSPLIKAVEKAYAQKWRKDMAD